MDESETTMPEQDRLKRDFARLRATLETMKDKLGGNAQEVLERVTAYLENGHLGERLDNVEEELTRLGARLRDSGKGAASKLEAEVTAKPLASIGIAFGVGLLAAAILRRR